MNKTQVNTILYNNVLVNVVSYNKHSSLKVICQQFGDLFKNLCYKKALSFIKEVL